MDDRESEATTGDREMVAGEGALGVIRRLLRFGCLALAAVAAAAIIGCGSSQPSVGDCTTGDPSEFVDVSVEVVDCGDAEAKSEITKKAKTCPDAEVEFEGQNYCLKPK